MAELKTQPTRASVKRFIDGVENPQRRKDARAACKLMQEVTGEKPVMWGDAIVGFGSVHYVGASGREGDWPPVGLSPRKAALTLYFMSGFSKHEKLLGKLGPHKTGKGCLYVKRLDDVDLDVLRELVKQSFAAKPS